LKAPCQDPDPHQQPALAEDLYLGAVRGVAEPKGRAGVAIFLIEPRIRFRP